MKIKLLVNLKTDDKILNAGIYDDSQRTLPDALYREVEIARNRGRRTRTVEILQEDSPALKQKQASLSNQEEVNTLSDDSDSINLEQSSDEEETKGESTSSKYGKYSKKSRRSKTSK